MNDVFSSANKNRLTKHINDSTPEVCVEEKRGAVSGFAASWIKLQANKVRPWCDLTWERLLFLLDGTFKRLVSIKEDSVRPDE